MAATFTARARWSRWKVPVPAPLATLEQDPFAEGDYYPGDLLSAVANKVGPSFWREDQDLAQRFRRILEESLARISEAEDPGDSCSRISRAATWTGGQVVLDLPFNGSRHLAGTEPYPWREGHRDRSIRTTSEFSR